MRGGSLLGFCIVVALWFARAADAQTGDAAVGRVDARTVATDATAVAPSAPVVPSAPNEATVAPAPVAPAPSAPLVLSAPIAAPVPPAPKPNTQPPTLLPGWSIFSPATQPTDLPPLFEAPAPPSTSAATKSKAALRVIVGLLVLVTLLALAGLPAVQRLEAHAGVTMFATQVLPFVALGAVFAHPRIGVLTTGVLHELRPLVSFALTWFGMAIGFRFDVRDVVRLPRGGLRAMAFESAIPAVLMFVVAGVFAPISGASLASWSTWRAVALLAIAAAMTAPLLTAASEGLRSTRHRADALFGHLDEIVGVVGIIAISTLLRPTEGAWATSALKWLGIQLVLGVAISALSLLFLRVPRRPAEFFAVTLGLVALAAGLSSYLGLSPLVVGFLTGTVLCNLHTRDGSSLDGMLDKMSRPLNALFLLVAGALWTYGAWQGWVLALAMVAVRGLARRWTMRANTARADRASMPAFWQSRSGMTGMSITALALAVSLELQDGRSPLRVTATVLAAFLISQIWAERAGRRSEPA